MTNVNKVPTYINNAMDNLEMLFSGISKNKALDLFENKVEQLEIGTQYLNTLRPLIPRSRDQ